MSVTAGSIVAATLFAVNYLMGWAQFRSPTLRKILSGEAEVLIRDGRADHQIMKRERLSMDEIVVELKLRGIYGLDRVRVGHLEENGSISARLDTEPSLEQLMAAKKAEDRMPL